MSVATQAKQKASGPQTPPARIAPISYERFTSAGFVLGDLAHVTLIDDTVLSEGEQNTELWSLVGANLSQGQWVVVENDAGSMYRVMRVARLHGNVATGLRSLVLYDLFPPKIIDVANEPVVPTGEWYVRWGGSFRKWMVITPGGTVRREAIRSEHEARNICIAESGNPRAR